MYYETILTPHIIILYFFLRCLCNSYKFFILKNHHAVLAQYKNLTELDWLIVRLCLILLTV